MSKTMTIRQFETQAFLDAEAADRRGDVLISAYFSKEEDRYTCIYSGTMDAGDALILINALIHRFGIDASLLTGEAA